MVMIDHQPAFFASGGEIGIRETGSLAHVSNCRSPLRIIGPWHFLSLFAASTLDGGLEWIVQIVPLQAGSLHKQPSGAVAALELKGDHIDAAVDRCPWERCCKEIQLLVPQAVFEEAPWI